MILAIAQDGTVEASSIALNKGSQVRSGTLAAFEPTLQSWAKSLKYAPEHVAGRPVATRIRVPVTFRLDADPEQLKRMFAQQQAQAKPECQLAGMPAPGLMPVAVDSPVTVRPTAAI